MLCLVMACGMFLFQSTSLSAQTQTTFDVTVVLQGYWNGTSHIPTAVAVELRTGIDLTTSTTAAITTGVLGTNATVNVSFSGLASGDYWLVVRHGSHLPVATLTRQTVTSGGSYSYDFSDQADRAFPGAGVTIEYQTSGVFTVPVGDLDGDRTVSASDFLLYFLPNFGETNPGGVPPIN